MLFSSIPFIYLFLPIALILYYGVFRISRSFQNTFLFIASLFFYAWGEPKFILVLLFSIIINWMAGLFIDQTRQRTCICRLLLTGAILFNLSILFIFKYFNFSCSIASLLLGLDFYLPSIRLPLGISFFTFQAISYVIDVYKNRCSVQLNPFYAGLFLSFFPKIVAGPIVRYSSIEDEILNRKETLDDFAEGFVRFIIGLSKKVLLANSLSVLADEVFLLVSSGNTISIMFSWFGAIVYTLQIYYDFSGYSDMAIGLGRMFGFHFLENFDYPYISTSVSEFWRRWHISLGTWFRDYLYIPMGGNRVSRIRNIFNLFVVWALTGLWHGANYTFIIWGIMYFILLIIEKNLNFVQKNGKVVTFAKWCYTILFVILGWVLFRSDTIADASHYIKSMFGIVGNPFSDGVFWGYFSQSIPLLIISILFSTPILRHVFRSKDFSHGVLAFVRSFILLILFILTLASLISSSNNPFIYVNF